VTDLRLATRLFYFNLPSPAGNCPFETMYTVITDTEKPKTPFFFSPYRRSYRTIKKKRREFWALCFDISTDFAST